MSIEGRKESLHAKHADLDKRLTALMNQPSASDLAIADLKKEKLAVKDELTRLEQHEAAA